MKQTAVLLAAAAGLASANDHGYSRNWSGATQKTTGVTYVEGTITVPQITWGRGAGVAAWVGIDGIGCNHQLAQTGISLHGDGTYHNFNEWFPAPPEHFDFQFGPGDQIRMAINATSSTAAIATLENLRTGQSVSTQIQAAEGDQLCQANADWIVEDFSMGGSEVPFPDFGSITFTHASAQSDDGTLTPRNAKIIDIKKDNKVLTDCSTNGDDLTCKYKKN